MKSVLGTFVTNIISEITAAQAYRRLSRQSPEPVLSKIALLIAGDEARHAASFFRFAQEHLASDREKIRGLEVLRAWLGGSGGQATHPVAQMMERLNEDTLDFGFAAIRTRVVRVIGLLLDLPLERQEDVSKEWMALLAEKRKS
jgi:hypothetical protein